MSRGNLHSPPFAKQNIVTLHAGELIFGKGEKVVKTLLGSCIAVTVFHPARKISGICHFALPNAKHTTGDNSDPRYAEGCFTLFAQHAKKYHIPLSEFHTHIVGGGNMLDNRVNINVDDADKDTIGERNARVALTLAAQHAMNIVSVDVGEFGYRQLQFNTATGQVDVVFTPNA